MTWGDVLNAAIGACCTVGIDEEVSPRELPKLVRQINSVYDAKAKIKQTLEEH